MKRKKDIIQWASDRDIIKNSTVQAQLLKTQEELDELKAAVEARDLEEAIDGVGDVLVTLIIAAHMAGIDLEKAIELKFAPFMVPSSLLKADCLWQLAWAQRWLDELKMASTVMEDARTFRDRLALVAGAANSIAWTFGGHSEDCLEAAWNEIKDRKGRLNEAGIFVKEAT